MMPGLIETTRAPRLPHGKDAACTRTRFARLATPYAVPGSSLAGSSTGSPASSAVGVVASRRSTSGGSVAMVPAILAMQTATLPVRAILANSSRTKAVPSTSTWTIRWGLA